MFVNAYYRMHAWQPLLRRRIPWTQWSVEEMQRTFKKRDSERDKAQISSHLWMPEQSSRSSPSQAMHRLLTITADGAANVSKCWHREPSPYHAQQRSSVISNEAKESQCGCSVCNDNSVALASPWPRGTVLDKHSLKELPEHPQHCS